MEKKKIKINLDKGELTLAVALAMSSHPNDPGQVSLSIYRFLLSQEHTEKISRKHSKEYIVWEIWKSGEFTVSRIAEIFGMRVIAVKRILGRSQPEI